jgi:hypothetical protein
MKPNLKKCVNRLIIMGEVRHYIFWRKKFELIIYYTPVKNIIFDHDIDGINIKKLDIDLSVDKLNYILKWCDDNNFKYFKIEKFTR